MVESKVREIKLTVEERDITLCPTMDEVLNFLDEHEIAFDEIPRSQTNETNGILFTVKLSTHEEAKEAIGKLSGQKIKTEHGNNKQAKITYEFYVRAEFYLGKADNTSN